jgi:hypothetical protein
MENKVSLTRGGLFVPPMPQGEKPSLTIQDAFLEVFFKGYQVRKNITLKPVVKETHKSLDKEVSKDLGRGEVKSDFIKRKTRRDETLDPLDIKNIRASEKEITHEDSQFNLNLFTDQNSNKNSKTENKTFCETEIEMIPQSIRNKQKPKKELSKLSSN